MQDGSLIRLPDGSTWRAPSLASADRERVRWYGFESFARMALPHVPGMPDRPLWNWHFTELCTHAQALYEGRCSVLNEMLPPGLGKSTVNIVLFPLFLWTQDSSLQIMTAGYGKDLVRSFSQQTIDLLKSAWFVERWGSLLKERKSEPDIQSIHTKRGGHRKAVTAPLGSGTGFHGDYYLLDDLIKANEAQQPRALKKVTDWIGSSVVSRGRLTSEQKILSGMQRLAIHDPAGALRTAFEGLTTYVELMLPYRFEPERRCVTPFGGDRRAREGEVIWDTPAVRKTVLGIERMTGGATSQQARAQLQQDPTTGDDAIFDSKDFQRFTLEQMPFAQTLAVISVDPTFTNGKPRKKGKDSDFVALEVWGVHASPAGDVNFYCYFSEEVRRGFNETLAAIIGARQAWQVAFILVELAAAGHPIVETLNGIGIPGVTGVQVHGGGDSPIGKIQKARAASYFFKARRVHFLADAPWYDRKARNLIHFPNGPHDDDVDTTTQALLWLAQQYGMTGAWNAAVLGWHDELRQLAGTSQEPSARGLTAGERENIARMRRAGDNALADMVEQAGIIDTNGFSVPMLVG
jgi:phage terminase large subunit-like protein